MWELRSDPVALNLVTCSFSSVSCPFCQLLSLLHRFQIRFKCVTTGDQTKTIKPLKTAHSALPCFHPGVEREESQSQTSHTFPIQPSTFKCHTSHSVRSHQAKAISQELYCTKRRSIRKCMNLRHRERHLLVSSLFGLCDR